MTREAGAKDPLHGITLEKILNELVEYYGWEQLAVWVKIDCFAFEPSITSSLRFLRRVPWARAKVEALYRELPKQTGGKPVPAPALKFSEVPICIRAQVKLFPQMDKPVVESALHAAIKKYFDSLKTAGSPVLVSKIAGVIMSVDGVEKLETFNFFPEDEGVRSPYPSDLKMGRLEVPVMGKVVFLLRAS